MAWPTAEVARRCAQTEWRFGPMRIYDHDVVIVGAGPAGIAAACAARESGLSVAIVDDNPAAGGQIWRGGIPSPWRERCRQEVIADTRVVGLIKSGVLLAESPAEALALRIASSSWPRARASCCCRSPAGRCRTSSPPADCRRSSKAVCP